MDYIAKVTAIGDMVDEFLNQNMIIIFDDTAPKDLWEVSVTHSVAKMTQEIKVGDIVILGDNEYAVTAVGSEANHTLMAAGHCTFLFNGKNSTDLPGQIELSGGKAPKLKVGDPLRIIFID